MRHARRRLMEAIGALGLSIVLALGLSEPAPPDAGLGPEPILITTSDFRPAVTDPVGAARLRQAQEWIDAGTVPGQGTRWEGMSRSALLDLALMLDDSAGPVPAAGAADRWNYFWPRDGAFIAVALHRTGHDEDAAQIVRFLDALPFDQERGFDARYLLTGSPVVTDPRGPQSDGCGWVLWMLAEIGRGAKPVAIPEVSTLRDRCLRHLLDLTDNGFTMPPPSPDYWEVSVRETSLGTVAPMVAGLAASAADLRRLGADQRAAYVQAAAQRLARLTSRRFGPSYQRFGDSGGLDAAVGFLMPPFRAATPTVTRRWLSYQREAIREAGGLAPGTEWKSDGISWTPEVGVVALNAAASGRPDRAAHWLDWLDQHRAPWGSLPEKVTRSGQPAGPAPLLWTGASMLLALDALDHPTPDN